MNVGTNRPFHEHDLGELPALSEDREHQMWTTMKIAMTESWHLGGSSTCAFWSSRRSSCRSSTSSSRPAGTRQKVLHVCVWRVHLAWTLAERAFMRLPHKANFRAFLDVAFNAPRHFLESPKSTFWSPPLRKSHFSVDAVKRPFGRGYVQEPVHDEPFV